MLGAATEGESDGGSQESKHSSQCYNTTEGEREEKNCSISTSHEAEGGAGGQGTEGADAGRLEGSFGG